VGFLIEAVIITWLVSVLDVNIFLARVISFSVAVTSTWAINRNFAFAGLQRERRGREYSAYFLVQIIGAALNLAVFVAVIAAWPHLRAMPVIPLAIGAAVALIFNFAASRAWVFNDQTR
jgi:putative flippase GtrA